MPLFEFICNICGQSFEELLRNSDECAQVNCPVCGSLEVTKKLSTIASRGSGARSLLNGLGSASPCSTGGT